MSLRDKSPKELRKIAKRVRAPSIHGQQYDDREIADLLEWVAELLDQQS